MLIEVYRIAAVMPRKRSQHYNFMVGYASLTVGVRQLQERALPQPLAQVSHTHINLTHALLYTASLLVPRTVLCIVRHASALVLCSVLLSEQCLPLCCDSSLSWTQPIVCLRYVYSCCRVTFNDKLSSLYRTIVPVPAQ